MHESCFAGAARWFIALFGVVILASYFFPGDRPTEFNSDVWVPDNAERAQRLAAKTAAWSAGRAWAPPEQLDRPRHHGWERAPPPLVEPNKEQSAPQLIRRHPMRPAN